MYKTIKVDNEYTMMYYSFIIEKKGVHHMTETVEKERTFIAGLFHIEDYGRHWKEEGLKNRFER